MKLNFKYLPLIALSVCWTPSIQAASFSLETNSQPIIQVGDFFDIAVVGHDLLAGETADELLAFGLNIGSSNNNLLTLTENPLSNKPVQVNPLFSDDSWLVNLDAAGSAFPGLGNDLIGASFTLATLHFQALGAGQVSLFIDSDLSDFNQGLFFLNQGRLAIHVSHSLEITAVPLPATALMFLSGLAMTGGVFRKRRS